ncbi:MAG: hypothetical protein DRP97_01915 [Candidatus Latescibacterota bacterium]|nr:MAG: hypothetical protein DRP97_01915 [Candidatus Latescibacterota bacterium]
MKHLAKQSISQSSIPLAFFLTMLSGCTTPIKNDVDPLDILFFYHWVGDIDRVHFNEPSGIVFHPRRGTLLVVGDEGDVCEIRKGGTQANQKSSRMERKDILA